MIRSIAAALAGIIVSMVVVFLVESVGHLVHPPPPDLDYRDAEAMRVYTSGLPLTAFLFVLGGWALGTLVGGAAAGLIARASFLRMAIIVGAFMLAATIVNLRMIPHPTWFAVTGIVLIIVMIPLAARLAGRFRARRVSD